MCIEAEVFGICGVFQDTVGSQPAFAKEARGRAVKGGAGGAGGAGGGQPAAKAGANTARAAPAAVSTDDA